MLSPLLFNLYSEAIFPESLGSTTNGIKKWINNMGYADAVIIWDNINDLRELVSTKTTKFMIISRTSETFRNSNLTFNAKPSKRLNKFKYLGTWLFEDLASDKDLYKLDKHF